MTEYDLTEYDYRPGLDCDYVGEEKRPTNSSLVRGYTGFGKRAGADEPKEVIDIQDPENKIWIG